MRVLLALLGVTGLAVLAWPMASAEPIPSPPSLDSLLPGGPAVFRAYGALPVSPTPRSPGGNRSHLPSSALPNTLPSGSQCSVDTTDTAPCSAQRGTSVTVCSVHCDADTVCSAEGSVGGANQADCSTLGGRVRCSVLQPQGSVGRGSFCSAFSNVDDAVGTCSVLAPGRKAACSSQNPAAARFNRCSTLGVNPTLLQCSVLGGGPNLPAFCSTGFAANPNAPKECSTFSVNSSCSIRLGNKGVCSNVKGAPALTCSARALPSHCSVIGGGAGTRCSQP